MKHANARAMGWSCTWCGWVLVMGIATSCLPAQETKEGDGLTEGAASLRNWVQPVFPEQARRNNIAGRVMVEFVVDETGSITDVQIAESTGEMFEAPALAAVRQWTFAPALEGGRPVASGMTVEVEFPLSQLKQKRVPIAPPAHLMPVPAGRVTAKPIRAPDPDYPEELEARKLPGEVHLEFTVDAMGRVRAPRVLWASHAAFVTEALRAAEKSTFDPARQGRLARESMIRYPVKFGILGARRPDIFVANGLRLAEGIRVEPLPEPQMLPEPVYPYARLVAGESGSAEVSFGLNKEGLPEKIELVSASAPEFGEALIAAVETWSFRMAGRNGNGPVRMVVNHDFQPPTEGPLARLRRAVISQSADISGMAGLDEKPRPLWRGFPAYPQALLAERVVGEAEIEFIIDRDGRARMLRVVSATRPEFGSAATAAVGQWVFSKPKRAGSPTDIRVTIPVIFTPPTKEK